jgi:hypothetical protein
MSGSSSIISVEIKFSKTSEKKNSSSAIDASKKPEKGIPETYRDKKNNRQRLNREKKKIDDEADELLGITYIVEEIEQVKRLKTNIDDHQKIVQERKQLLLAKLKESAEGIGFEMAIDNDNGDGSFKILLKPFVSQAILAKLEYDRKRLADMRNHLAGIPQRVIEKGGGVYLKSIRASALQVE